MLPLRSQPLLFYKRATSRTLISTALTGKMERWPFENERSESLPWLTESYQSWPRFTPLSFRGSVIDSVNSPCIHIGFFTQQFLCVKAEIRSAFCQQMSKWLCEYVQSCLWCAPLMLGTSVFAVNLSGLDRDHLLSRSEVQWLTWKQWVMVRNHFSQVQGVSAWPKWILFMILRIRWFKKLIHRTWEEKFLDISERITNPLDEKGMNFSLEWNLSNTDLNMREANLSHDGKSNPDRINEKGLNLSWPKGFNKQERSQLSI